MRDNIYICKNNEKKYIRYNKGDVLIKRIFFTLILFVITIFSFSKNIFVYANQDIYSMKNLEIIGDTNIEIEEGDVEEKNKIKAYIEPSDNNIIFNNEDEKVESNIRETNRKRIIIYTIIILIPFISAAYILKKTYEKKNENQNINKKEEIKLKDINKNHNKVFKNDVKNDLENEFEKELNNDEDLFSF